MGKHLILVGAGHAHMVTLARLHHFKRHGHRVTVIGPSEYHYYSGMGPGLLGQAYTPEQIRFATRNTVEKKGGRFIQDKVLRIDPKKQMVFTASGATFHYDALSFNAGSYVPCDMIKGPQKRIFTVKPIEGLIKAQQQLITLAARQYVRVAVIGGGAAGIEVAGNIWRLLSKYSRHNYDLRIFCRKKLLHRAPQKVRMAVEKSLRQRGIKIVPFHQAIRIRNHHIDLKPMNQYRADLIFLATGVRPSPIFKTSGLPVGPDGGLMVNRYLQCPEYPTIFGGGDCIYFKNRPLDKVGVYAVRQNPILYDNLMASMNGWPLNPFFPKNDYLLILNMGDGTGILHKKGAILKGRMAFWIKDFIDKKFMRKFQSPPPPL